MARWYFPPEVDYRLSLLHPDAKGLVVWIMEAKVMQWSRLLGAPFYAGSSSGIYISSSLSSSSVPFGFLQVLSKAELQFLAMLPDLRPKVRVIAECGNWYVLRSLSASQLSREHL